MAQGASSTDTPILEIDKLSISYFTRAGELPAVVDFSLTVHQGESVGLVGESGCGKSTVAMAILRYLGGNGRIVGGTIRFQGRDLTSMNDAELRKIRGGRIAMVYQEPFSALNPSMRIGRQLMEVPLNHEQGCTLEKARQRSLEMLEAVRLPDPQRVFDAYPHQISGGQQQRVVIAMALLAKPALLLLDEPTTALDVTVEAGIVDLISTLSRRFGTSLLYISHNLGLILETCDRVCVMYSGEVAEEGPVRDVFASPRHPYSRGLLDCIPTPARSKIEKPLRSIRGQLPLPHQRPDGCFFGPRCDHFREGVCDRGLIPLVPSTRVPNRRVRCVREAEIDDPSSLRTVSPQEPLELGSEVLRVEGMRKYYDIDDRGIVGILRGRPVKTIKANETLDFSARKAETLAVVGESGCGKSTFAKVLMGLETATEGRIVFDGIDVGSLEVEKRDPSLVARLQMIFQNPNDTLNPSMSVGGQIGRAIRKFGIERRRDKVDAAVRELLRLVKLPEEFATRKPRQLSGGQKQRVGIARAFAGRPALVVADEPVSALDVSVQAAVTGLLVDIQRQYGTTMLFISHDLGVVRYLADRVVVMYLGQVMEKGSVEEIFNPPFHPYTEALLSAVPIADAMIEKKRIILEGALPSAINPPKGCPFCTRCPRRIGEICDTTPPPEQRVSDEHTIRCHIPLETLREVEPVIRIARMEG